jgi:thioredoxin-like negative regulator of GroEL
MPGGETPRSSELILRVSLARALEATGAYSEALANLAPVLAQSRRSDSAYAGAAGAGVRLLHARLLARSAPVPGDCEAANETLQVAPVPSPEAAEASILAADCELRHGRATLAGQHLDGVPASGDGLDQVSPYARERLVALRRVLGARVHRAAPTKT